MQLEWDVMEEGHRCEGGWKGPVTLRLSPLGFVWGFLDPWSSSFCFQMPHLCPASFSVSPSTPLPLDLI